MVVVVLEGFCKQVFVAQMVLEWMVLLCLVLMVVLEDCCCLPV